MTKKKKLLCAVLACAMSAGLAVTATACGGDTGTAGLSSASIVVKGYDWGPGVSAVVAKFDKQVSGITKDTFTVKTANANRKVKDAYCSDKDGNRLQTASEYVTFVLEVEYTASMWGGSCPGNPFSYDMSKQVNNWSADYNVSLKLAQGKTFKAGDKTVSEGNYTFNANKPENRILQTDNWHKDSYRYQGEGKDITLSRASWAPEGAATDGGKNPLIIWLHGGGEGGTDIDIALLGNEVTGLTDNDVNVQHYFKTGNSAGAYVLAVQSPTMWMDAEGNGEYGNSSNEAEPDGQPQTSYYTEALYGAITDYVTHNSDIDTNRIYVGGCSNGGYMTVNLALEYNDYFAAYYPVCQGYMYGNLSDEAKDTLAASNIWFLLSEADRTLLPSKYTLPLFAELVKDKGAQNVHLTLKENVKGNDSSATYDGHWSWIYAFNDDVKNEFENSSVTGVDYLTAANCTKDGNMWKWLSEQSKGGKVEAEPVETYEFEAENAVITDGKVTTMTGWDSTTNQPIYSEVDAKPTVETGTEYTTDGSTGATVTNVGYFSGTSSITWTITAEEECDVTISLRAAAAIQDQSGVTDWQTGEGLKFAEVDMSKNEYLTMKINGVQTALTGVLPGIDNLNWAAMQNPAVYRNFGTAVTATVHLNKGTNTIVLNPNPQAQGGLNIDKITVTGTTVKLSYIPADNSGRVPQQQPQG